MQNYYPENIEYRLEMICEEITHILTTECNISRYRWSLATSRSSSSARRRILWPWIQQCNGRIWVDGKQQSKYDIGYESENKRSDVENRIIYWKATLQLKLGKYIVNIWGGIVTTSGVIQWWIFLKNWVKIFDFLKAHESQLMTPILYHGASHPAVKNRQFVRHDIPVNKKLTLKFSINGHSERRLCLVVPRTLFLKTTSE